MNLGSEKELIFADLHIHSKYSRATSKDLNLVNLEKWAKIKGLNLLGTGDFTHPKWLGEIKINLKEKDGILYSSNNFKFILTGEISLIYTKDKGRRVHLVIFVPNLETADKINLYLDKKGRRDYDGRPIFKISCEDFVKDMHEISDKVEIIPAHAWTPWFGIFGSESGFDSLEEAFGSQLNKIHAVETGISSNPQMNLRLKELKEKTIVSFSDSHSYWPWRIGREATIFYSADSYDDILKELRENKIFGTIEVNPAYGKYHYDGHRLCNFSCSPEECNKLNNICPVCKNKLLLGVEHRVNDLANFPENYISSNQKKSFEMLPLHEILATALNSGINTKKVWNVYYKLIEAFENEFNILLNVQREKLLKFIDANTVDLILKNREGKIRVKPGYDGVYGEMIVEADQKKLF
ncbi:MAG: endonuclease Q family protein [Nanoarchaeota archaeon]